MSSKRSIRFYNDHKVRAVWSEEENGGLYDFAGQIRTKTIWKDGAARLSRIFI